MTLETLQQARQLLDTAIAESRPITHVEADSCRAVAARLRAEGFKEGERSITDRLAAVRREVAS